MICRIFFFIVVTNILLSYKSEGYFGLDNFPEKPVMVKGGYRSCSVFFYPIHYGKVDSNSKSKLRDLRFDDKGNLIEEVEYPGYLDSIKHVYRYDEKNNLIYSEKIESSSPYQEKSKWLEKYTYKYNDRGTIIEILYNYYMDKITKFILIDEGQKEKNWFVIKSDSSHEIRYKFKYDFF